MSEITEIVSEYYGTEKYKSRYSQVVWESHYYSVKMFNNNELVEHRPLKQHSEHYAEDCAENWVLGII